nr:hypothetical protein BaRGS_026445 [Batillaria attramentaria]
MADLTKFVEYAKSFYLQRVAVYSLIVLSSFFVIIPMGLLQTNFDNNCLLYADVAYEYDNTSHPYVYFKIRFGPASVCEYSLGLSALFSLIYPLAMIGGYLFIYVKDKGENKRDLAQLAFLVHILVEVVVSLFMLVSACTISAGFTDLCDDITNTGVAQYRVDSCSDAQNFHDWRGYDGSNFHECLSVATAGSWFQFVFWLLLAVFGVWKLWRLNMLPVLPDWMKPGSSS